jgi:hypothetical protein
MNISKDINVATKKSSNAKVKRIGSKNQKNKGWNSSCKEKTHEEKEYSRKEFFKF